MGCVHLKDKPLRDNRRLDEVMRIFPIRQDKRREMASQMSGSQQQMLALGRGLMAAPDVILHRRTDAGPRRMRGQRGLRPASP